MTRITQRLCTLLGLGALILGAAIGQNPNPNLAGPFLDCVPGEVLVRFETGVPPGLSKQIAMGLGATDLRDLGPPGLQRWKLPPGLAVKSAISLFASSGLRPLIRYAEPNYLLHGDSLPITVLPDDPRRSELWNLHNLGQTGGTPDADIDALEAWQIQTGSHQVVVAVIDSGIDYLHEDLATNIWVNPGEIPGNGLDDDGNGYVDDVRGWDFVNDDDDPMDDHGHGTHMAGIIGAVGNNGIGVSGVCWSVSLMPLKFLDASNTGTTADAVEAILYAAALNVPILSNSWGGVRRSRALEDAIESCGALFVASAGNNGSSRKSYPAAYGFEHIIAVNSTTSDDAMAFGSNYGTWVDLGAPGQDILSTVPGGVYGMTDPPAPASSAAVSHVSGVAALVMADNPGLGILDIKAAILNGVDIIPSLQGTTLTGGRLNAVGALGGGELPADILSPEPVLDLAVNPITVTETGMTLTWTATGDDGASGTAWLYDLRYQVDVPITGANWGDASLAAGEPLPQVSGSPEIFMLTDLEPSTTYYIALMVMDEVGNAGLSNVVGPVTTAGPPPGAFVTEVVDTGSDIGFYKSLAFDPGGRPAIAYTGTDTESIKFAHWNGATWEIETVSDGGPGIALAFSPSGSPAISHGWGKLKFAEKVGSTWNIQTIENSNAHNDFTCLLYDDTGNPCIAYEKTGGGGAGLRYARRIGSSWSSELVDPGSGLGARYKSLAFHPTTGHPAIAYSANLYGEDYIIDTLKFARWNGTTWDVEIVEGGPTGYGVWASLAFDPTTGHPSITHGNGEFVRLLRWDGTAWQLEIVGPGKAYALAYDSSGTPYIAQQTSAGLEIAHWDGSIWQSEPVDPGATIGYTAFSSLALDSFAQPALAYRVALPSTSHAVKLARKSSP